MSEDVQMLQTIASRIIDRYPEMYDRLCEYIVRVERQSKEEPVANLHVRNRKMTIAYEKTANALNEGTHLLFARQQVDSTKAKNER